LHDQTVAGRPASRLPEETQPVAIAWLYYSLYSTGHGTEMALRQWKEAYNKKYARQCHEDKPYYIRKKDATWIIVTAKPKVSCIFTVCCVAS